MKSRLAIVFQITNRPDLGVLCAVGRDAWALQQLKEAGEKGCTPIDNPAPRWSHYCFKLRRLGLDIETVTETHGGPFAGHHARYVLHDQIRVTADNGEGRTA